MSEYMLDANGIIHLKCEHGSEYMFCGISFESSSTEPDAKICMVDCDGPSNCLRCRTGVDRAREAMKGSTFTKIVFNEFPDPQEPESK